MTVETFRQIVSGFNPVEHMQIDAVWRLNLINL